MMSLRSTNYVTCPMRATRFVGRWEMEQAKECEGPLQLEV